jgi:hypothetical protein
LEPVAVATVHDLPEASAKKTPAAAKSTAGKKATAAKKQPAKKTTRSRNKSA